MKNRTLALALSAGLAVGGIAGVALGIPAISGAQGNSTTTQAPGASSGQAQKDHDKWMHDALQPLVDNGTITQDQMDAVVGALDAAKPQRGHGPGGPGHGGRRGADLDVIAKTIGINTDDLVKALEGGSTVAQVAKDHGVEPQAVVDAVVAQMKTHLDEAVAAGKLTQDKADKMLADAPAHITAMINGERPQGGTGHGPGGGPGGRRQMGPDQDDDGQGSTTTTTTN